MKKMWNEKGQLTLFDSILFFVIMLIASGLFMQVSTMMAANAETLREQQASEYTDLARLSLLASYIPSATYSDGRIVQVHDRSVQYLLTEQLRLMKGGLAGDNFAFDDMIRIQANMTIDRIYDWAIRAESGQLSISITKSWTLYSMPLEDFKLELGDKVHASTLNTLMFGTNDEMKISIYIW